MYNTEELISAFFTVNRVIASLMWKHSYFIISDNHVIENIISDEVISAFGPEIRPHLYGLGYPR